MRKQQNQTHKTPLTNSTKLVLFNKPFEVLCQFSAEGHKRTLAEFIKLPNVYAAGRLDFDSEGLMVLTDNGKLQQAISDPRFKLPKTYWVQVEGEISNEALHKLRNGITLNDGPTLPAEAERIEPPDIWERNPPIRERKHIPTSWIALTIKEGRNRQVRRMTAATGFPTLRLIRAQIGPWSVQGLAPGDYRILEEEQFRCLFPGVDLNLRAKTDHGDKLTSTHARAKPTSALARRDPNRGHPPKRPSRPSSPSSKKGPRS